MEDIINYLRKVRRGAMFLIEAPSGTGKGTVIKELLKRDDKLKFSISVTTRAPRHNEVDGVDYYFISDEQYDKYKAEDAFYELVVRNARRKAEHFDLDVPFEFDITLSPVARVKKQLSSFKGTVIEGWYGEFLLQGNSQILDLLYQTGIGAKNPEGYGMFEVRG